MSVLNPSETNNFTYWWQQLIKKGDYDEDKIQDLVDGKAAINDIVTVCNRAAERAQREQEVAELIESVDDWKGHRLDHFGELVISGQHTVLKGDSAKAEEREVSDFLFLFLFFYQKHEMNSLFVTSA